MVDAAPFRALRYDPRVAGEPASTSAPAYDELERLSYATHRAASPYTVLDLITGGDVGYEPAAATLGRWRRTGVLVRDPTPRLYRYEQHELRRGAPAAQRGVLAAVRLPASGEGEVLPHEAVDPERVAQRRQRLEAVPIDVSPVYAFAEVSPDGFRAILAQPPPRAPLAAFTDTAGVDHRLWPIEDPSAIVAVRRSLLGVRVVLADGHHRFAAAIAARDRRRETHGGTGRHAAAGGTVNGPNAGWAEDSPWERTLMYVVDAADAGPEIRAVHRLLLTVPPDFLPRLRALCHMTAVGGDWRQLSALLADVRGRAFGLYLADGPPTSWLVRPRDEVGLAASLPPDRSARWRALDTAVLDYALLPRLGVTAPAVVHRADAEAAATDVEGAAAAGVFFLRPVSVATVSAFAAAREPMPPKTTHFRPKPRAGLVMRPLG